MRVLIGYSCCPITRTAFERYGHEAWTCDLLPARDGSSRHLQCDVWEVAQDRWDMAIFHPMCTYLTVSAAWAFKDPDFDRYPGVGYHQHVGSDTLTGAARRGAARALPPSTTSVASWRCHIPRLAKIRRRRSSTKAIARPIRLSSLTNSETMPVRQRGFGAIACRRLVKIPRAAFPVVWLRVAPALSSAGQTRQTAVKTHYRLRLAGGWSAARHIRALPTPLRTNGPCRFWRRLSFRGL